MKTLKKLLLAAAFVFCVSMSAAAQQQQPTPERDGKRTKQNPPVIPIVPKDKPKDEKQKDDRNNDNRGKKPQAFIFDLENTIKISFV